MLIENISGILTVIIAFLAFIYTIFHNSQIFDGPKVLYDIFIEIRDLNPLYEDYVNPFIYPVIYIIVIDVILYICLFEIIPDIFTILLVVLFISLVFLIITTYSKEPGEIPKDKVKNYKSVHILFHIYIALGIGMICSTVTVSPAIIVNSTLLPFYFVIGQYLIIAASIYLILFIEIVLYQFARKKKLQRLNQYFRDKQEKLKMDIQLKNGNRLNGTFVRLYIDSLFLMNSEDMLCVIKYKQIEIVGCKFIKINKE